MVLHGRFPYLSYPRRYRPEDHAAARRALEQADAWELARLPVQTLSGGQRQKVYLAMALAQNTQTILMDEPTTYLDIQHQLDLMAFSQALAREGRAVVLVLHDLCLALRFAHRGAVLSEGRLLQTGTPEELFSSGILAETFRTPLNRIPDGGGLAVLLRLRGARGMVCFPLFVDLNDKTVLVVGAARWRPGRPGCCWTTAPGCWCAPPALSRSWSSCPGRSCCGSPSSRSCWRGSPWRWPPRTTGR